MTTHWSRPRVSDMQKPVAWCKNAKSGDKFTHLRRGVGCSDCVKARETELPAMRAAYNKRVQAAKAKGYAGTWVGSQFSK